MKKSATLGLLLVLVSAPIFCQNQTVGGKPIGSGEIISTARVADPNELVGINGRIVRMADLVPLFSSLDSLKDDRAQLHAMIDKLVFDRTTAMAALYGIRRDEFVEECLGKATERLKELQQELQKERSQTKSAEAGRTE